MNQLDQISFESLFRSEYKGLCFFAQMYVKDGEAAREIVQEAFMGLWENRETIDISRNVRAYLTTGIRNKCLNYLRDNKKFHNNILEIENLPANYEQYDLTDSDHLTEQELHTSIQTAISELPEKCREVFLLSRNENLKYREISDKLGISVKTVEAQMSKALQYLRTRLAGYLKLMILIILCLKQ
jgi:RNA polymerase sigma-70 factor, ECF subfamily